MHRRQVASAVSILLLCTQALYTSQSTVTAAVVSAEWTTTQQWSNAGPMMTDEFGVTSSEWRVVISSVLNVGQQVGALPLITVTVFEQTASGTAQRDSIQTTLGGTYSQSIGGGPGRYYLQMTSASPTAIWTVRVEEQR